TGSSRRLDAGGSIGMTDRSRLRCKAVADRVMSAEEAAAFIAPGNHVGMSGFTGSGHPKAVPAALVRRVTDAASRGDRFTVSVWTGSPTAPPLGGAPAALERSRPRRALPALPAGEDHRRGPDARPGLQPAVQTG